MSNKCKKQREAGGKRSPLLSTFQKYFSNTASNLWSGEILTAPKRIALAGSVLFWGVPCPHYASVSFWCEAWVGPRTGLKATHGSSYPPDAFRTYGCVVRSCPESCRWLGRPADLAVCSPWTRSALFWLPGATGTGNTWRTERRTEEE
jgi:hypothetical protein